MKLPAHTYLDERAIPYEARSFLPEIEKGAASVARALGFRERQMVKTLVFQVGDAGVGPGGHGQPHDLEQPLGPGVKQDVVLALVTHVQVGAGCGEGSYRLYLPCVRCGEGGRAPALILGVEVGPGGDEPLESPQVAALGGADQLLAHS